MHSKLIIIGSGPAAHTAAIYTARARLEPLLFEGFLAGGIAAGGQLTTTSLVENFPGFAEGIEGPELMERMRSQSLAHGARIVTETIHSVDVATTPFTAQSDTGTYHADALIIATGATALRLHVTGEETFWDKGISACAVCDGALPLFRDKPLFVIGGGDSACEEALYLTKFGSSVTLCVRRDELRASRILQERIKTHAKINILWNTELQEVRGDTLLRLVILKNNKTNKKTERHAAGLFYAIGHKPNTDFLPPALKKDAMGYVQTKAGSTLTSVEGVFACGDVQDAIYRQAITAAGSGCMAALDAEHWLSSRSL